MLIAAILCGILSSVPAVDKPDNLGALTEARPRILVGVFFQAMMAITYVAILVITYPIVRMTGQERAIAYLALRAIGAAFLFVGIVTLLLFLSLGQQYAAADAANAAHFKTVGELLRYARDGLNHIGMILPWSLGGLFLYRAFWKTGLIPSWLSIWGMVGSALTVVATLLYMLSQIQIVSVTYMALNMPLALLEISLAIYLITQGFRCTPSTSDLE